MMFKAATPILRMFDIDKAREFYIGFLGFETSFEHRFGPDFPLYMGIRRGDCTLHLSEHHGDGTPGTVVRVEVAGLAAFHRELAGKNYRYYRPGIDQRDWGDHEMAVQDPFGNRIIFFEPDR